MTQSFSPFAPDAADASGQTFWLDPALPFVESRRAQHSRACYRSHTHPALSIGAVDAGRSTLQVDGACAQALQGGDVVVIPPHCAHACNPEPGQNWSYQMLYLDETWLRALVDEGRLTEPGLRLGYPALLRSPEVYRALCALNRHVFSPAAAEAKECALIDFVGGLVVQSDWRPDVPPAWLEPMRLLLRAQCEQNWSVSALAARAGLSRYHFIRAFSTHTGMTPHAFQLDCRINLARRLLRQGVAIADLAYRLGFADQSHFQHAFKARVSATPGEYLRAATAG
jgi:AraC-like DNA-binding protein